MNLSSKLLKLEFETFKNSVFKNDGSEFISFTVGLPDEWESYKLSVRKEALDKLAVSTWSVDMVGTGQILTRVIETTKVKDNNLLYWRTCQLLSQQIENPRVIEQWFFDLYLSKKDESALFDHFAKIVGANNYRLIAYLFFLKDDLRFAPIVTKTFDAAFTRMGIKLKTTGKCSWDNYQSYNNALLTIRDGLKDHCGVGSVRLIDAHSFCWMLIDLERELEKSQTATLNDSASSIVEIKNSMDNAIEDMVKNAKNAAGQSGKAISEKSKKVKSCSMSSDDLSLLIKQLLEQQEGRCSLSGIILDPDDQSNNGALMPSLDRIDSDIGYEVGNLQVVCRFLNFWKSDEEDTEFRRLLVLLVDRYRDPEFTLNQNNLSN